MHEPVRVAGEPGNPGYACADPPPRADRRPQKERYPGFAEHEEKTDREIPVVLLRPAA